MRRESKEAIDVLVAADRLVMGIHNKMEIEKLSLETVLKIMHEIYKNFYEK